MPSQGALGHVGAPAVSWPNVPEEKGYRRSKSPGAGRVLPPVSEPATEHTAGEQARDSGSEPQAKRPERGSGQSERSRVPRVGEQALWPRRWGPEAQGTHRREGDAGQNALRGGTRGGTSRPPTVSTTRQRSAQQAVQSPAMGFTTLAHRMDVDVLREAYRRSRKAAVPGVDGVTAAASAEHLEAHLSDRHERRRSGR